MAIKNMLLNSDFEHPTNPTYNWQLEAPYVTLQNTGGIGNSKCVRFDPHPTGAPHHLSQSMDLVPGATYQFKCQANITGPQLSLYFAMECIGTNGQSQWQYNGIFNMGTGWREISYNFTVPSTVSSENVWLHVRAANAINSPASSYALVDNILLIGEDGVGGNVYARTSDWVVVSNAPSGSFLRWIWPNALCKILGETVSNGTRWINISRLHDGTGWITAQDLGLNPFVPGNNPDYVQVKNGVTANVHKTNSLSATSLGKPKSGSIFKFKNRGTTFTEILWGKESYPNGSSAYIKNEELDDYPWMPDNFTGRMTIMTDSFIAQDCKTWDYSAGNWCQNFVNNMAISAGLLNPGSKLMPGATEASNTLKVMQWLRNNGVLSESSIKLVLNSNKVPINGYPEAVQPPELGDWLYVVSKQDAEAGKTTSHVEIVVERDPSNLYRVRVVSGDVTSAQVVASRWYDLKNMRPTGPYEYYYVAHGHPNW